ncbi:aminopeptidase P family protein [Flammeovirgaceae bacterium SG7u.111]|nr:aminopeptidase P family protein [Flammeovirgaceae bacterium SG7u.132]WPO35142.1 aminopeptidase P family protein [Flammeovirgaceae bacterium SG7u.111]
MFDKEIYIQRREVLKQKVGSGLILLLGNEESSMNYKDNCYSFRQDSSFLYYFGLDKPGFVGIIDVDKNEEVIFGNDLTIDDIVWTGPLPTMAELVASVGVKSTFPYAKIAETLQKALAAKQVIHILPPYRPENTIKLSQWLGCGLEEVASKVSTTLIKAVVAQRSIKSSEEVDEIEKAVEVSNQMHLELMKQTKIGQKEVELVGKLRGVAISAGGDVGYPIILTKNGQTLHNHFHDNIIKENDMVLCDAGAATGMHYTGDLTRTVPAGKKFTPRQKELYNIVLNSFKAAVAALKPGVLFKDVHLLACETLADGLKEVGLMKGDTKEAVAAGAHAMFFQCGLGHMMGLDVHDMEDLGEQYVGYTEELKKSTQFGLKSLRLGKALEEGFVITVEPGIYIIPELIDLWKSENKFTEYLNYEKLEEYRDFGGIRVEDDFLITESGYRKLGGHLPLEVEEIEAIRAGSF